MKRNESLAEELRQGLKISLFRAEQAFRLQDAIGERAGDINNAAYGDLFGTIQQAFVDRYVLEVCKIFEPPNQRHPNRSLPSLVERLEREAPATPLRDRDVIESFVITHGRTIPPETADAELTEKFATLVLNLLPDARSKADPAHVRALDSMKMLRDKRIAHNENFESESVHKANFGETQGLLAFAKELVGLIARAYTDSIYAFADGTYSTDTNAARVGAAIKRLLREAGIGS